MSAGVGHRLLPVEVAGYRPHPLHDPDRIWQQTNCSLDVWIETLHSLGQEPLAAAAFSVATDFEGEQWQFFTFPPEDLRRCYGIEVHEANPWRGVLPTVVEQLDLGRLMTVEVDSWYLPDTAGVSYGTDHVKSTIVVNAVDPDARCLGYFHNAGYHELRGDDFDGVFRIGWPANSDVLPPYVELIRLEEMREPDPRADVDLAWELLAVHAGHRPRTNPVERMVERMQRDLAWLADAGDAAFHDLAFATVRQCGASAEVASAFCTWLADRRADVAEPLRASAAHWLELAQGSKSQQMRMSRVARGRSSDLAPGWAAMAAAWGDAQRRLDDALGLAVR